MNAETGETIDWRDFQPACAEPYKAAALAIQEEYSKAEILDMKKDDRAKLEDLCGKVGITLTKQVSGQTKPKDLTTLRKELLAIVLPKGKEPPHGVFKFGQVSFADTSPPRCTPCCACRFTLHPMLHRQTHI